ncbi:hypothetical protein LCGC14_2801360, partial [marine sediment metagenome]
CCVYAMRASKREKAGRLKTLGEAIRGHGPEYGSASASWDNALGCARRN